MTSKFAISDTFINAAVHLTPKDAVAAIILDEDNRVLLQLRDDREDIFFPNHWGCFGGAIEADESPKDALLRELREELGVTFDSVNIDQFITITFNPKPESEKSIARYFFVVKTNEEIINDISLGEGRDFDFFACKDLLRLANVSPYDKFGLWLYFNQGRLSG